MAQSVKAPVHAALVTPFDHDLRVDHDALAAHCHELLNQGCDGLVLFGTTGEAASLERDERRQALDALLASDVPPERLIVGTGSCALGEAVDLTRHAVERGTAGVLVIPPFYYKPVTDDALYAWYAKLIENGGGPELRLHLYNFPSISGVAIGPELTARLRDSFPAQVVGYKDSGGDLANTRRIIAAAPDLDVRVGSEAQLLDCLEAGGAGCISATINVFAPEAVALARSVGTSEARGKQEVLARRRGALRQLPSITAVKHLLARRYRAPNWSLVRLPLLPLSPAEAATLDSLAARRFDVEPS